MLDSPICGTIVSNIWEDNNDINEIDYTLCSLDDRSLCGDSIKNYAGEFTINACKYNERGKNKSPPYASTLFKTQSSDYDMHWLPKRCCYLFIYKMPMHRKRVSLKS